MQKKFMSITGLLLIAAIVLAVNLIGSVMFRRVKLDMTEENLFTLSKGSVNILRSIEDDVTAKLYYSKTAAGGQPVLKTFAGRIVDLLGEYEAASKGKLKVEIEDPRPDTPEEDNAVRYGLRAFPGGENGEPIYLGLVLRDESGNENAIPVFSPDKEERLEYEISKAIYSVAHPDKKKVGVVSSLDVMGGPPPNQFMPMQRPQTRPWVFVQELRNDFDVQEVETAASEIPDDLDLLIIVHPKSLSEATLYAIDQYVLGGGKALVFVDAFCQADQASMAGMMNNPQMMMQASFHSNMPKLFKAWGVEMMGGDNPKVVADANLATKVQTARAFDDMIVWLSLGPDNRNSEEIVSNELENLMMVTPGGLSKTTTDDKIKVVPLIETTDKAAAIDGMMLKFGMDPASLRRNFTPGSTKIALAYKITGSFKTAFPDGKPKESTGDENDKTAVDDEKTSPTADPNHLATSKSPTTILIVSDVDMISDRYSVRTANFFGNEIATAINDNLLLLANAAENMTGSQDLIGLRSRGKSQRPFKRVQEIERAAAQKWREQEQELNKKLQEANQRLSELQRGTDEKRVLDQAYMAEVRKWREEKAKTSQQLRDVRRKLREDREKLGFRLAFINIAMIPLLVALCGIGIAFLGSVRRRKVT